jgi:prevent-host-death family protein
MMTMAKTARRAITSASLPKGSAQDVAAAEFKARCLELMDRVKETGAEYVITKHGRPVAKLVPYTEPAATSFIGSMSGTVLAYDRPFEPIDGEYDVNRE